MEISSIIYKDDSYKYLLDPRPTPAVGLLGTPALWDTVTAALDANAPNGERVAVLPLKSEDMLLKKKEKNSYENYACEGVMKRDWCRKHQRQIMGCVVVLFDWDMYSMKDRGTFEQAVSTYVDRVRSRLRGRGTRVILVLYTKQADMGIPSNLYPSAEECCASVRRRCDLDARSVQVLHHADTANGLAKLQRAAHDSCVRYHKDECARIKRLKTEVNKVTQPVIFARHRFKVAWHFEILHDAFLARKYYEQCYIALRSVPPETFAAEEVRFMGALTMYRLSLVILRNSPQPDLDRWLQHYLDHNIWYASPRVPPSHPQQAIVSKLILLWVQAEMHQRMGEMIQLQWQSGRLVPHQINSNPGFFFHYSAQCLLQLRNYLCDEAKAQAPAAAAGNVSGDAGRPPNYVGQEYLANGDGFVRRLLAVNPMDVSRMRAAMLTTAQPLYRQMGLRRMCDMFTLDLAEHHFFVKDYEVAFQVAAPLLSSEALAHLPGVQRRLGEVLVQCTTVLKKPEVALRLLFELATNSTVPAKERKDLMGSIAMLCEQVPPTHPLVQCVPVDALPKEIVMTNTPLVKLCARFERPFAFAHSGDVVFHVALTTECVHPLQLRNLHLAFLRVPEKPSEAATPEPPITDDDAFTLSATTPCRWSFRVKVEDQCLLECTAISVYMGQVRLVWSLAEANALMRPRVQRDEYYHGMVAPDEVHRPVMRVVKPFPKLTVSAAHDSHVIEGGQFLVKITVASTGDSVLSGTLYVVSRPEIEYIGSEATNPSEDLLAAIPLPAIAAGGTFQWTAPLRCIRAGKHKLPIVVRYGTPQCADMVISDYAHIHACHPFFLRFTLMDTLMWRGTSAAGDGGNGGADTPTEGAGSDTFRDIAAPNVMRSASFLECSEIHNRSAHRANDETASAVSVGGLEASVAEGSLYYEVRLHQTPLENGSIPHVVFHQNTPVLVSCIYANHMPFPIRVHKARILPNTTEGIEVVADEEPQGAAGVFPSTVGVNEELTVTFTVRAAVTGVAKKVSLGSIRTLVTRERSDEHDAGGGVGDDELIEYDFPLPSANFEPPVVEANLEYPPMVNCGETFEAILSLRNCTHTPQRVEVSVVDPSPPCFLLSGRLSWAVQVPPSTTMQYPMRLTAQFAGHWPLPGFTVKAPTWGGDGMAMLLQPHDVRIVFVSPLSQRIPRPGAGKGRKEPSTPPPMIHA